MDIVESLETGAQTMRNIEVQFTGKNNLLCSLELEMDIVSLAAAAPVVGVVLCDYDRKVCSKVQFLG